jgi:surface polysaccharide O-acyltransferase-like enzyme
MARTTEKSRSFYILLVLAISSLTVTMAKLLSIRTENAFTFFIPFIGYYLLGFQLRGARLKSWHLALVWLAFIATVLITIPEYWFFAKILWVEKPSAFDLFYVYCNPVIVIMSICAYLIISNSIPALKLTGDKRPMAKRVLRRMAQTTFGIYLIHPLVLENGCVVYFWILYLPKIAFLETTILAGCTILTSFILISLIIKAPYFKDLVS